MRIDIIFFRHLQVNGNLKAATRRLAQGSHWREGRPCGSPRVRVANEVSEAEGGRQVTELRFVWRSLRQADVQALRHADALLVQQLEEPPDARVCREKCLAGGKWRL